MMGIWIERRSSNEYFFVGSYNIRVILIKRYVYVRYCFYLNVCVVDDFVLILLCYR